MEGSKINVQSVAALVLVWILILRHSTNYVAFEMRLAFDGTLPLRLIASTKFEDPTA